jgi:phage shock protein E
MKKRIVVRIVALLAGVLVLSACSAKSGSIMNMNAKDFAAKTHDAGVVILDVRTPAEFNQGHIQGAVNMDVEASTFDSNMAKLDKTKSYAVYCRSGNRSVVATQAMSKAGFTHLYNLENGINDWMSRGMPTVMS